MLCNEILTLFFVLIDYKIICMEVFYIKINEETVGKCNRIELKKLQSLLGRHIVEYVGKSIYKIENTEIVKGDNKPEFKYSDVKFSISHSNNIIVVVFDEFPVGIDIEIMKDRDFRRLSGHHGITASDKEGFYRQWTQLEAGIKLQNKKGYVYTEKFENEYMLTVISANTEKFIPKITKLDYPSY